jgi:hypothetical protein
MRVAIHQSQYLPWPPYFKKMASADVFVLMDNVQFQKNGVQNRNQIRNKEQAFWLTIPVTGHLEDLIKDEKLADARWPKKHLKSIEGSYSKAPFWQSYGKPLLALYEKNYATLGEVNEAFLKVLIGQLGIATKMVRLSELGVSGAKSELVLNACRALKADAYVSGPGAKSYLDESSFQKAQIAIDFLDSAPPMYSQFHGGEFISGLSVVDMLFNVGAAGFKNYLEADVAQHPA